MHLKIDPQSWDQKSPFKRILRLESQVFVQGQYKSCLQEEVLAGTSVILAGVVIILTD